MEPAGGVLDRAARNAVVILIARLIEIGSGFLIMMILCRYLKPALFGDYAFISAVILAFQPLVNLEMNTILIREISKDRAKQNELLGGAILLKAVLMSLFVVAAIGLDRTMTLTPLLRTAYYLAVSSELLQQIGWIFSAPYMAKERMEFEMLSVLVFRIVHLGGIAFLPVLALTSDHLEAGFIGVFLITLIAHLIKLIFTWRISSTYFQMGRLPYRWRIARDLLDQMWIMGLATFCTGLSLRVDVYFLKAFRSSSDVSMFHVPHMIVLQMQILAVAVVTAAYPSMSRFGADRALQEKFRLTRDMTFRFLSTAGLVLGAIVAGFSPLMIRIIAGRSFDESVGVLRILAVCIPILFINYLGANLLTAMKHQHLLIYGAAASLLSNTVLDYLWVPRFGAVGAGWATVVSYGLQLVILGLLYIRLDKNTHSMTRHVMISLVVSVVMTTAMIMTTGDGIRAILLDMLISGIGVGALGVVFRTDLRSILKRPPRH